MQQDWRKSYKIRKGPIDALNLVYSKVPILESKKASFPNDRLLVGTIHEGEYIPEECWNALQEAAKSKPKLNGIFEHHYAAERDWGADLVSSFLIDNLNQKGYPCPYYYRVNIARVLMDFGRFPGITPAKASHLSRFAINYPFSHLLDYDLKKSVLENYYDEISRKLEQVIHDKTLSIAIHTYDKYNEAGTERPLMSVITRPLSYQTTSQMPLEFFDPLYPAILGEYTADRKLTYRISLTLEQAGIPVAHNYPYNFPDGSVEMRAQVWFFLSTFT